MTELETFLILLMLGIIAKERTTDLWIKKRGGEPLDRVCATLDETMNHENISNIMLQHHDVAGIINTLERPELPTVLSQMIDEFTGPTYAVGFDGDGRLSLGWSDEVDCKISGKHGEVQILNTDGQTWSCFHWNDFSELVALCVFYGAVVPSVPKEFNHWQEFVCWSRTFGIEKFIEADQPKVVFFVIVKRGTKGLKMCTTIWKYDAFSHEAGYVGGHDELRDNNVAGVVVWNGTHVSRRPLPNAVDDRHVVVKVIDKWEYIHDYLGSLAGAPVRVESIPWDQNDKRTDQKIVRDYLDHSGL